MGYLANKNLSGSTKEVLLFCKTNIGGYFFDGYESVKYDHSLTITQNPVETGASIVDHSYVNPAKITITVLMSDVHQSLISGQFEEGWSRSVSAWNVLRQIQEDRIPISVLTRLNLYENMLIEQLTADDDSGTYESLTAEVTLKEIPLARVKTVKISEAPQITDSSENGSLSALEVSEKNTTILYDLFIGG